LDQELQLVERVEGFAISSDEDAQRPAHINAESACLSAGNLVVQEDECMVFGEGGGENLGLTRIQDDRRVI